MPSANGKVYVAGECMLCRVELHEQKGFKIDGQKRWNFGIRGMSCSAMLCKECYAEYRCATPQCRVKELIDALMLKGHQQRESDSRALKTAYELGRLHAKFTASGQ